MVCRWRAAVSAVSSFPVCCTSWLSATPSTAAFSSSGPSVCIYAWLARFTGRSRSSGPSPSRSDLRSCAANRAPSLSACIQLLLPRSRLEAYRPRSRLRRKCTRPSCIQQGEISKHCSSIACHSLIDWLINRLFDYSIDWLIDWLTDYCITDWFIDLLIDWLLDYLIDWLIDWFCWFVYRFFNALKPIVIVWFEGCGGIHFGRFSAEYSGTYRHRGATTKAFPTNQWKGTSKTFSSSSVIYLCLAEASAQRDQFGSVIRLFSTEKSTVSHVQCGGDAVVVRLPLRVPHSSRPCSGHWPFKNRTSALTQYDSFLGIPHFTLFHWPLNFFRYWINQSINRTTSQSTNQSNHESINQSINQTTSQSINQSNHESINQSIERRVNQSINRTTSQSINQSISHMFGDVTFFWLFFLLLGIGGSVIRLHHRDLRSDWTDRIRMVLRFQVHSEKVGLLSDDFPGHELCRVQSA